MIGRAHLLLAASLALLAGCGTDIIDARGTGDVGDDEPLVGAPEVDSQSLAVTNLTPGSSARVCASALNQRSGPGTGYAILRVIPSDTTVTILRAQASWYEADWGGRTGWSDGRYLCPLPGSGGSSGGAGTGSSPPGGGSSGGGGFDVNGVTRDNVISIAKAAVGYSYWWGHGDFDGAKAGSCTGSCPNCSHGGNTGADCSGLAAKAWMLPEAMPIRSDKHPFSTGDFVRSSSRWRTVSRDAVQRGDALTYNANGAGHIFIYESGDGWGSMWTYEARGCSYGVVHNLRTAGSAYKAIARSGL